MELLALVSSANRAMLRSASILFQVVTRTRNSLIRLAVRYSIPDKHDPTYRMLYIYASVSRTMYSGFIFNLYPEIMFAIYKTKTKRSFDEYLLKWNFTHMIFVIYR